MPVYLDWNATTPPHPSVLEAMWVASGEAWGNPASIHSVGRRARDVVEGLRELLARTLGADARDVIFTSGGTEANNLALANAKGIVTSRIEHPSVVRSAERLAARGVPVEWMSVRANGEVDVAELDSALARLPEGSTVAVMAVNHETGVIQPLDEVLRLVRARGARLHVDAVQSLGKTETAALREVDSVAVAAHKFRGPKGVGALVWRGSPALLTPVLVGGPQERGLRPGTLDATLAAGFHAALERAAESVAACAALGPLRDRMERELEPIARPNFARSNRVGHVASLAVAGWRGDELVAALDLEGVQISSGSACSAGSSEPSAVLSTMFDRERARSSVRVSLGETTSKADVDEAISAFRRVISAARHPT
jgi:cysteine desulfurase